LLAGDTGRVTGLVVPNDQSGSSNTPDAKGKPPGSQPKPGTSP
jgi:hypothetical protein